VWALLIVVTPPFLDLRLRIGQIQEHFDVQAFVPQSAIEALDVSDRFRYTPPCNHTDLSSEQNENRRLQKFGTSAVTALRSTVLQQPTTTQGPPNAA
jgi:hypothetical protein